MTHKSSRPMDLDRFRRRLKACATDEERILICDMGERVGDVKVKRAAKGYARKTILRRMEREANREAEKAARLARYRLTGEVDVMRLPLKPTPIASGLVHKHKTNGGPFPSVYSITKADKAYCRELRPYVPAPPLENPPYEV